jgi:hydroxymethylpyrimidine pyrophosphatase-like HAD family hydrolase
MIPPLPDSARPAPLREMPRALCRGVTHLFTDIDDTLTANGMLPAASYTALAALAASGIRVVAVTGRPAGWCDHIARMWPVAGVVGENGAFVYRYDRKARRMRRIFSVGGIGGPGEREALAAVAARVLREVPGTALAADQPFRISDYAIDFCEDVPPLSLERVDDICRILEEEGVRYKVSSIHVNFWKGDFDKMKGVRLFLAEEQAGGADVLLQGAVYIGDSPNDEPLFEGFPHTIAVGNLRRFLGRLQHRPEYITEQENAEGFCAAAALFLEARGRFRTGDCPGCTP